MQVADIATLSTLRVVRLGGNLNLTGARSPPPAARCQLGGSVWCAGI
jgi:hypothetical protein